MRGRKGDMQRRISGYTGRIGKHVENSLDRLVRQTGDLSQYREPDGQRKAVFFSFSSSFSPGYPFMCNDPGSFFGKRQKKKGEKKKRP
jgi:hypothetical protein